MRRRTNIACETWFAPMQIKIEQNGTAVITEGELEIMQGKEGEGGIWVHEHIIKKRIRT